MKFDGAAWEPVGPTTCTDGQINNPVVALNGDAITVAFTDADMEAKATCMRYEQASILFPPTDLQAELVQNDWVKLTWNAPVQGTPESYIIYRNDMIIGEAFEFEYTDENLQPGTYHYTVTAKYLDGESTPAGPVSVETTLSIDEAGNSICLYPTIATSMITISSNADCVLNVYNSLGQKAMNLNLCEGENHIDVSGLANGIYFIANCSQMVKFIKQ